MRRSVLIAATLAIPLSGVSAAQFPEPGFVFESGINGPSFHGWMPPGGGYWGHPTPAKCCYSVFAKPNSQIILLTVPIRRNATGGVVAQKIVEAARLDQRKGEEWDNEFPVHGVPTITAVGNPKTRRARGVAVENGKLVTLEGRYNLEECETSD